MDRLTEFIQTLDSLASLLDGVTAIEHKKAKAAAANTPALLDGYIREEQAAILKLRGLEQSRERLAADLGWKDMAFRQILEKASPEQRLELDPCFRRLERSLASLDRARDDAGRMIRVRLHELESVTDRLFPGGLTAEWRI